MKLLAVLVILFSFFSCSLGTEPESNDRLNISMNPIKGSVNFFALGGKFNVKLNYPFEISQKEITLDEYQQVLNYNPIPSDKMGDYKLSYPVTFVSYFDAVRFCNALSLQHKLDTVYSYSTLSLSKTGSVETIEGLFVDYSKNGFRLPTESEWEYSSTNGKYQLYPWGTDTSLAKNFAWFANNANGSLHNTCDKAITSNFCDMAGNALEWVDGFLTDLPTSDSSTNFIGSQIAPIDPQRIVKGGSYESTLTSLQIKQRKDVYPVYSETKAKYIGFRIAKGIIPSPQSQNGSGVSTVSGTAIKLIATKEQVKSFFYSSNVKIAMINGTNGNLSTLDFSHNSPQIKEWPQAQVRHPSISPNGMRLVMGTASEGQSKSGKILLSTFSNPYQLDTLPLNGAIPRFWVNPISKDTSIIYSSTAAPNSDSISWSIDKSYMARFCNNTLCNEPPHIWYEHGGFHDGISNDGRFGLTAYQELRVLDRDSNKITTYFQSPLNGKTSKASSQACNASIGGLNNYIMFLDFGSQEKSNLIGRSYGIHEYLFFMDPATGIIKDTVIAPQPWKAWNHSEWSNHPYYAIATVTDASEQNRAVYAIRFPDHAVLKLAEGDDIITPHLWVDSDAANYLYNDSLFNYLKPNEGINNLFSYRLLHLLKLHTELKTIAIGSSRTLHGVDISLISQQNLAINMASQRLDLWSTNALLSSYTPLLNNLESIIIEISLDFAPVSKDLMFMPLWGNSIGYKYDQLHGIHLNANTTMAIENRIVNHIHYSQRPLNGFEPIYETSKTNDLPQISDFGQIDSTSWITTLTSLTKSIKLIHSKGIKTVIVIPPQNPKYRDVNFFGRNGVPLYQAQQMLDSLNQWTKGNKGLTILNEHKLGLHDYTLEMFYDDDHLSINGAIQLSNRIKQVLDTLSKP